MDLTAPTRLLLVGAPGTEFRIAAGMAREAGAQVAMADTIDGALNVMRKSGGDLVMIAVEEDVAGFIAKLRSERIAVPVLACGIDAPASLAVAAIRAGARDYVPLPPDRELIAAAITSVARHATRMIGQDPVLDRATGLGLAMAHATAPILISGEPGCGKEMMARIIHDASGRPGRFLVVECAGVAPEILESEMFGHEEAAFAGAVARRRGRIEEAADGTVFLRDIAALAPSIQSRLLHLLQEQSLVRLGGGSALPLQTRIIAGTSVDLEQRVLDGRFRSGLMTKLGLVHIIVPSLRDRGADIALLTEQFSGRFARENGLPPRSFGDDAMLLLRRYAWPGNIRELEEVVHRAVLLSRGPTIQPDAVVLVDGTSMASAIKAVLAPARAISFVGQTVEDVERELILKTLERCRGNRTSASTILGISVRTMRNKLKTFIEAGIPILPVM